VGKSDETQARILHGAEEVVLREGVARLTLDAAAAEAGVSKGGVLYHFPTRDALVRAMVDRLGAAFDADLEHHLDASGAAGGGGAGAFTKAYVLATVSPAAGDERDTRLGAAVIAGMAADPTLLEALRDRFAEWQRRVEEDGLAPDLATVVRLAADGLWLAELFGLAPPSRALRAVVAERLLALCEPLPATAADRESTER
jgi:AcrR family transcriptional regulator